MAEQTLKCPKCGGEIRYTSAFCEHCGTPVTITMSASVAETEDTSKAIEDPQLAKDREAYFNRRKASSSTFVDESSGKKSTTGEISVNPIPTYRNAVFLGGLVLGMNFFALLMAYLPVFRPDILMMLKKKLFFVILFGFLLPIIAYPLFKKKVKKVDRRGVRRSMRFIMVFNWLACAAPIFMGLVMILENFLEFKAPFSPLLFHNLLLLLCYIAFGVVAFYRYIAVKSNKSIGEIQMALHFDTPTVFAFSVFATVIFSFALFAA